MPVFLNPRLLVKSFRYALRGMTTAWKHEQNFRVQVLAAVLVIGLGLLIGLSTSELTTIILICCFILTLEILNSMVERLADIVQPRIHDYVRTIKDLMAAAVLLVSFVALVIGLIIFIPHIF